MYNWEYVTSKGEILVALKAFIDLFTVGIGGGAVYDLDLSSRLYFGNNSSIISNLTICVDTLQEQVALGMLSASLIIGVIVFLLLISQKFSNYPRRPLVSHTIYWIVHVVEALLSLVAATLMTFSLIHTTTNYGSSLKFIQICRYATVRIGMLAGFDMVGFVVLCLISTGISIYLVLLIKVTKSLGYPRHPMYQYSWTSRFQDAEGKGSSASVKSTYSQARSHRSRADRTDSNANEGSSRQRSFDAYTNTENERRGSRHKRRSNKKVNVKPVDNAGTQYEEPEEDDDEELDEHQESINSRRSYYQNRHSLQEDGHHHRHHSTGGSRHDVHHHHGHHHHHHRHHH